MSDHENCDRSEGVVGRAERRPNSSAVGQSVLGQPPRIR
jgi:hypothetical protein